MFSHQILTAPVLAAATAYTEGAPVPQPDYSRCCRASISGAPAGLPVAGQLVVAAPGIVVAGSSGFTQWVGYPWAYVKAWYLRDSSPGPVLVGVLPGVFAWDGGPLCGLTQTLR